MCIRDSSAIDVNYKKNNKLQISKSWLRRIQMIFKFKRFILCLFVLIVSLFCVYPTYASVSGDAVKINGETYRITSSKNINVYIERSKINFDVEPIIIENRTMVPLRFLANAIGIKDNKIIYDETEQSVILEYNGKTIKLIVGDKNALIDIDEVELDVPAVELNNRVLVPLRFVCETFGYNVDYGETETSMNIFMKKRNSPTNL